MATIRVVGGVGVLAVLLGLGCADPGVTTPSSPIPEIGPVRSLALSVAPDRLPYSGGSVDVEVRATTDPGLRLAGDAVRLILIVEGREAGNPLPLDDAGVSRQRLFLATATVVRVTGGSFTVERAVSLDGPPPLPPPSEPPPPPPPPAPPPPPLPPVPTVTVTLSATTVGEGIATTFTAIASSSGGAPPVGSYQWDFDNNGTTDLTTATPSTQFTYATSGTKTAKVTAIAGTLSAAATTTVTVTAAPLFVGIVPSTFTPALGASVTFEATVTSSGPVPPTLQWQWDDTDDGTYEVIVPSAPSPNVRITVYGVVGATKIKVRVVDVGTLREATSTVAITIVP